ncbi:hypothetical protein DM860_017926 [Cuscuta australis]|uniref:Uncharacterized protein n=1 Tax=Cuscuta australis TaxID=267555 RepID=A0A328DV76_9ASTE|nr:hypothetical protein DM860_017924 [Cuscuta australis]RAL49582.1 hypothetical protein DM860_017926 [Cuscuta australis]
MNRDVAVDGNVRDSGDVGGGPGKSYLFCLTTCPPWKRLSRSETTTKGTGLAESAGKEDPVELDSSLTL